MRKLLCTLALPVVLASASYGGVLYFSADLLGANENPPNASPGTGSALVTFDTIAHTMRVQASFSGLVAGVTAAHIHCCVAPPGNVSVATTTPTFPGFPAGVTSGVYDSTFDMTLASSYRAGFIGLGTVAEAEATLLKGLRDGQAYFNIHSTVFGGGEIRDFLTEAPEPATFAAAGFALAALVVARLRRV